MTSLYERLGGEAAVEAAVVRFYELVLLDPSLAPFFGGIEIGKLINKQVAFMTMAFGGPHEYTGQDLRKAHASLVHRGLSDAHFDAVANHLAATLRELGVAEPLVAEVLGVVGPTRNDVLCR